MKMSGLRFYGTGLGIVIGIIAAGTQSSASMIEVMSPLRGEENSVGVNSELTDKGTRIIVAWVNKGHLAEKKDDGFQVRYFQITAQLGFEPAQSGNVTFVDFEVLPLAYRYDGGERDAAEHFLQFGFGRYQHRRDAVLKLDAQNSFYFFGTDFDSGNAMGIQFMQASVNLIGMQDTVYRYEKSPGVLQHDVAPVFGDLNGSMGFQGEWKGVFKARVQFGISGVVGPSVMPSELFGRASLFLNKGLNLIAQGGVRFMGGMAFCSQGDGNCSDNGYTYLRFGMSGSF